MFSIYLYIRPCVTFRESTFCPQSVFMCFVWISEQRAVFFPPHVAVTNFINNRGLYLLRSTGWIFTYDRLVLSLDGRSMALVVSRWPFTAENRDWSKMVPCEICGGQWHWKRLCPSNSVLPCQLVPIFHLCYVLSSYTCCSYQEDKWTTSANPSKWIDKYLKCFHL
jgi:hypothetical protein